MQAQARTVTAIAAAVEQTAIAAESSSRTITGAVANGIEAVAHGFGDLSSQLQSLRIEAETLAEKVTAGGIGRLSDGRSRRLLL